MRGYWRFLRSEAPVLSYGILLTFVASFGQTFFISLFVPSILADLGLTSAAFGGIYSAATLTSALLLPLVGGWIDRYRLTPYTLAVLAGLAASSLLLAGAWNLWILAVALLGLRITGQGLSPHTGLTTVARHLNEVRGKALSVASLGFPLGEAVLPLLVVAFLGFASWRMGWVLVAGAVAGLFLPAVLLALGRAGLRVGPKERSKTPSGGASTPSGDESQAEGTAGPFPEKEDGSSNGTSRESTNPALGQWRRGDVLRDPRFWLVLPAAVLPPFWTTGLILYQGALAQAKGWTLALMASGFLAFASCRVLFSLLVGPGIDRWSARALFPLAVLPMGAGIAALALFDGRWAAFVYLGLLGTSLGVGGNLKTALWAELYGVRHLGAIKSLDGSLMVLSTAAAPLLVGGLVEDPDAVPGLLWSAVASVVLGALLAYRGIRRSPVTREA